MRLTTNWLQAIDGTNALAATIRYSLHGFAREVTPADAGSIAFEETAPVRKFPDYPHKRNVEGRFSLASTGQHVPFESFWERAFLMSLDRTRSAESVSSQPMWIHWRNPKRSHAPDYFFRRKGGTALLVDVRERSDIEPEGAAKFELTRRMAAALGWDYLVFDDLPGATQRNLRFLLPVMRSRSERNVCTTCASHASRSPSLLPKWCRMSAGLTAASCAICRRLVLANLRSMNRRIGASRMRALVVRS